MIIPKMVGIIFESVIDWIPSNIQVRIATRTLTLNVYRVQDEALRRFLSSNEHLSHFGRVFRRLVRHWEL